MSICPCDQLVVPVLHIPAGLSALPRQIRAFPEIRRAMLAAIPQQPALQQWRARNSQDLGLMLIDMWAYVSDVLAFYDERIANEEYLRTAVRRPSLRRLVDLLGYIPSPGLAGTVTLAAIADGKTLVTLPAGTGFRSDAFGTEAPQVFELTQSTDIHPLKNSWTIGPQPAPFVTLQQTPTEAAQGTTVGVDINRSFLVFETKGFGLSKGRLALVTVAGQATATVVQNVTPFGGKDGQSYNEVQFDPPVVFNSGDQVGPADIQVQVATASAGVTQNEPADGDPVDSNDAFLDAVYRQLHTGDPIIVSLAGQSPQFIATTIEGVFLDSASSTATATTTLNPPVPKGASTPVSTTTVSSQPVTVVEITDFILPTITFGEDVSGVTFQFAFVNAGVVTTVGVTDLTPGDLGGAISINGIVAPPPDATASSDNSSILTQEFLITDLNKKGVDFSGTLRVDISGHATLTPADTILFPPLLNAPLTAYGNVLLATRGESVNGEVLGSGNASLSGQQFSLKKKPLTYVPADNELGRTSTLSVFVDGVQWKEVRTFFNCGPQSQVFIVRPDDNQNTIITFGDGVRGSRVSSGVNNVIASYRFGSGAAAPPAGAIQQIAKSVIGLRAVRSPVAAFPGKDADTADQIRQNAPRTALLFNRLVSIDDFQGYASQYAGVVQATAEFVWFPDKQQAGVAVTVIGDAAGDVNVANLQTALISLAEQSLIVNVAAATPILMDLTLNIEVDTRFHSTDVLAAVVTALIDEQTGPLALAQAAIGARGQFLASPIYETVQSVPGVISLQSASISFASPVSGVTLDVNLGADHVVCVPAGSFFDFVDPGAQITALVAVSQGPASASRGEDC